MSRKFSEEKIVVSKKLYKKMFQKVHFTTFTIQKNFYFFPLDFKNNKRIGTISLKYYTSITCSLFVVI